MNFGYFDDTNKEYVITTPATPLPWINYLGNEDFFSLISNTCGGYSFYKDAKLLRLTRYRYNNVPADTNGRYYFIKHGDTVWTPSWQPVKTKLDQYECRHGLGYSIFHSSKNGIEAKLTAFVPLHKTCEVNQLVFTNQTDTRQELTLTSYVEFCFWNAVDDAANFQRNLSLGEVEVCGSSIYHKTEYRERRNHYAYYTVNADIDGFDTSRDEFLGVYGSIEHPKAVLDGVASNSVASGGAVIGSHHFKITLEPGENKSYIFLLGYSENPANDKWEAPGIIKKDTAKATIAELSTDEQVAAALDQLKEYWNQLLSIYSVESADEKLNRMVNIWNQYQCMVTFNMSRSASYFESGTGRGMGFRDSCQDLLGFVHLIPDRAFEIYRRISPAYIEEISDIHRTEPYVYSQMIAGKDAPKHGEAKNSWLTGTAAWTFVNVSQYILGIRPTFDGLEIDPCIPSGMDGFTVRRQYRGAVYDITVKNPDHVEKGVKTMTVNGKKAARTGIVPENGVEEYKVEVIMGQNNGDFSFFFPVKI